MMEDMSHLDMEVERLLVKALQRLASIDESMLWHRRLGHLNFKTINKLVRNNLVKGLPSKCFENDHTCVACLKRKQHRALCKTKLVNSVSKPLHTLHMDLFGPTSVSSLNHKWYCLVVTDDFSRFTWTFFPRTKDETSSILRNFITEIENLKDLKVKIIRCDNGGEFKNQEMNEFCTKKRIRREFSNARTPQQNEVAERRNKTFIEAARTMLADAKLPVTFWAEAVNTACYVQNRVLVNKSQNKTSYELFNSRIPAIGFLRPIWCLVMILNTLDHLGKFDAKGDEGYFFGYSLSSKAFRVFNKKTKKVEENLHVDFLENKLIKKGASPNWLFDIDTLTNSMNYVPVVVARTSSTNISGTKDVASQAVKKDVSSLRYIALPNWFHKAHMETSNDTIRNSDAQDDSQKEQDCNADVPKSSRISNPTATSKVPSGDQVEPTISLIVEYDILTVSSPVPTVCLDISPESSNGSRLISKGVFSQKETPSLGNALTLSNRFKDTFGDTTNAVTLNEVEADLSNMETSIPASPTPTLRIHKDYPKSQIISLVDNPVQTRHKSKDMEEQSFIAIIHQNSNPKLLQFCLFLCFLSQEEPKKIFDALKDPRRGIDYEEVFAPVVKIEAIRLFLAFALFMGFIVYQMDVKSAFLYGTIVEEGKDRPGKDVELYLYRSMIRSLMYLTASRPDIMFVVCACARHQVTPKECHLYAVKRIFRYLKGHPKLGLWFPKESSFDLVAYLDSDYGGAIQDRKSTTEGCQFLGRRLISWQCKKQTIVATSTTKAEYVAAASGHNTDFHQIVDFLEASYISPSVSGRTVPLFSSMIVIQGEGSAHPTEPHHTPSPQEHHSLQHDSPPFSHQTFIPEPIPHDLQAHTKTLTPRRLTRRAIRIAQSKALLPDADEPASLLRDDRHGEAFPIVSSLDAGQDRENIAKTSTMPHESSPRVPSLDADEGSMQQRIHELMELYTSLERQQSQMAAKIKDQDLEISGLKARVKSLEDKERRRKEHIQEDAPITGGIIDIWEELGADKSTEKGSNDTKEMINVLSSIEAVNILSSGGAAASVSLADVLPTAGVPTVSGSFPTVSEIFTTASVVAREMEEEFAKENQRLSEQVARDSEIARIHDKEELKMMIEGLDRSNEVIAKHLSEYEQAEAALSVREKIELINFVPMYSKEESERVKRPGLKLDQGSLKWVKISHTSRSEPSQEQQFKGSKGVYKEELKGMMQLVPLEKVYIEALQATKDKEKELWVELKRLFKPDYKVQLWTYHQAFMHDPLD
nr:putative ribonuclease H-like domain-containing protein [Tanacetum cinerariifolium]